MAESEQTESEKYIPILSRLRPPQGAVRGEKRRGRGPGSGLGKTSGKGMKGQKARHPNGFSKLGFEGGQMPLYRRIPKFGFKNIFALDVATVNVSDLGRFEAGQTVDIPTLLQSGLVKGRPDRIKILGKGDLDRALTVSAHAFSKGAQEKIEKAGGSVTIVEVRDPAPVVRHKNKKKAAAKE
ncbi:MAG: 50S ribosomal protein L15 [Myxococcales bacterium]|nr:50S ribosomal protein L15 [Myxococcales bacterium]